MRSMLQLVLVLCLSLAAITTRAVPADADAWAAYESGDYNKACDLFLQLFRDRPQDERVNFGLGLSAMKAGKLSHARFAFERLLVMNADNQRARVELARTLAAMELYDLSREEFEKVLLCNPPEKVRTNIEAFLHQIKRNSRSWTAGAQLSAGAFYDDNINIGPSESLIDTGVGRLEVNARSRPESAWGASAGASAAGTYDLSWRRDWLLTAGLNANQTLIPDSPDYEVRYLRAQGGLRRPAPSTLFDLPIKVEDLNYGHEPFVSIVGAEPMLLFAPSRDWHHITQAVLEYRNYAGGGDRDGMTYKLSQTVKRFFGPARHSLALSLGGFQENADLDGFANSGPECSVTGELRPLSMTTLYGLAMYRQATYREILMTGLQTEARKDHEYQVVAGIRQSFTAFWGVDLSWRHIENQSNFGLYDYDRNMVNLSTFMSF